MDFETAFRHIAKQRGYTLRDAASAAGASSGCLGVAIRSDSPAISTMLRYLSPLGYRVSLVPEGSDMPDGCFRLDEYREPLADAPEAPAIDLDDPNVMIG